MTINTELFSDSLRKKSIDTQNQRLLVTRLQGSEQEKDLTEPPNCSGLGRIRHFRRKTTEGWPQNPLPIDPVVSKLGISETEELKAQVFQNAVCNWRCWYCYVPFDLLSGNSSKSEWMSAGQLLDLYQQETAAPALIDLTGGQPDLTPEWIPWMMRELKKRDLHATTFLWSDDNLSNDYFWKYLSTQDVTLIKEYVNYGKVCCFKGFNENSFSFNTSAEPRLFETQFNLFRRYLELGIDLYAYATFTSEKSDSIAKEMSNFVDRLQDIHSNLPLRTIPLEIRNFSPMKNRKQADHERAIQIQWEAIACWKNELSKRFDYSMRQQKIHEISLLS